MLTRFCARYTFMSAILKDRLTSATARLSVNSSIDHGAPARRLMRPKCAAFALRKWNDESSTRPGAAILISVAAKASSWLDDFAPKFLELHAHLVRLMQGSEAAGAVLASHSAANCTIGAR